MARGGQGGRVSEIHMQSRRFLRRLQGAAPVGALHQHLTAVLGILADQPFRLIRIFLAEGFDDLLMLLHRYVHPAGQAERRYPETLELAHQVHDQVVQLLVVRSPDEKFVKIVMYLEEMLKIALVGQMKELHVNRLKLLELAWRKIFTCPAGCISLKDALDGVELLHILLRKRNHHRSLAGD